MAWFAAIPAMFAGTGAGAAGAFGGASMIGAGAAGSGMLGKIALASELGGSVAQMGGSLMQGKEVQAVAGSNADAMRVNADIMRKNAALVIKEGHKDIREMEGKQETAFIKGGVLPSTGSPLMVMADAARDIELNALREKSKYLFQAGQYDQAADEMERRGKGGMMAGIMKSITPVASILSTIAKRKSQDSAYAGLLAGGIL